MTLREYKSMSYSYKKGLRREYKLRFTDEYYYSVKIKEVEQLISKPPTFMFAVNDLELVHFSYQRYLENLLREKFSFKGTPILLKFRQIPKSKFRDYTEIV